MDILVLPTFWELPRCWCIIYVDLLFEGLVSRADCRADYLLRLRREFAARSAMDGGGAFRALWKASQ